MSERLLFLDIDGVLNSAAFFERTHGDALSDGKPAHMIDPACVARLNSLLDRSGAQVVISSSWRSIFTPEEISSGLRDHGFTGTIIGATPQLGPPRGHEIQRWLTDNHRTAERIVILDDNSDMAHLTPCLVCTSWGVGLTDADVARALEIFGVNGRRAAVEGKADG